MKNNAEQKTRNQTCACGTAMLDNVCSNPDCRYNVPQITTYEQTALDAITAGRTMGQMPRELPADTSKGELQQYAKRYDKLRSR